MLFSKGVINFVGIFKVIDIIMWNIVRFSIRIFILENLSQYKVHQVYDSGTISVHDTISVIAHIDNWSAITVPIGPITTSPSCHEKQKPLQMAFVVASVPCGAAADFP